LDSKYIIVLITVPSREDGDKIATHLLRERLVACINVVPAIHSHYMWESKMCKDNEFLLICKTGAHLFETGLVPAVEELHPYDVPEILAIPILAGNRNYLNWIDENIKS